MKIQEGYFSDICPTCLKKRYFEFELISHSTKIAISLKMFGLENLFDEKDMFPHEMFGRHTGCSLNIVFFP